MLRHLLLGGIPDAAHVATLLQAHRGEQAQMLSLLHTSLGNAYVQSVIQLNPNAPPPKKQSSIPLTTEEGLKAQADKITIEQLLKSKSMDAGNDASQALKMLLEVDADHVARVIDGLDDKAFENLLSRSSDAEKELLAKLAAVSKNASRKLQLWQVAHIARAENDIARLKGDAGRDVPKHKHVDEENGGFFYEEDEAEKEEIEGTYTRAQQVNRKRHNRRTAAVETTKDEVATEVNRLQSKQKAGDLTLADVEKMMARKDLEYEIERDNNLNLTAAGTYTKGEPVEWSKDELEAVKVTLDRLPQVRDPDSFSELRRIKGDLSRPIGGEYKEDENRIEMTDFANNSGDKSRFKGDLSMREGVSDEFAKEHGYSIGAPEYVLTHEFGHDVDAKNPKAKAAFEKAAGWKTVTLDELVADGVKPEQIETLENQRAAPNFKEVDITGNTMMYTPIPGKTTFWAVPITAIPSLDEGTPAIGDGDSWEYSRVNSNEHFAEVYAKAVHLPVSLHDDLIVKPTAKAEQAEREVDGIQKQIDQVTANALAPNGNAHLVALKQKLAEAKQHAARAQAAKQQRGEQFAVMRNDVFHTNQATALALERLKAKRISPQKLNEFERAAATMSTPEQIAILEKEAMK